MNSNSTGLMLAFVSKNNAEGHVVSYDLHLVNETFYETVVSFEMYFNEEIPVKWEGKILANSQEKIGNMPFDGLNQAPEVKLTQTWITTEKITDSKTCLIKIKPKSFFKRMAMVPILNVIGHVFLLASKPDFDHTTSSTEDLIAYTRQHAKQSWNYDENPFHWVEVADSKKLASFSNVIDLHIEKLRPGSGKLSNSEIIRIQLEAFEKFMQQAIMLGVERVFIIHGIGKGKLREEIKNRLDKMPKVKSHKNEYHPKFGWGATEVIL